MKATGFVAILISIFLVFCLIDTSNGNACNFKGRQSAECQKEIKAACKRSFLNNQCDNQVIMTVYYRGWDTGKCHKGLEYLCQHVKYISSQEECESECLPRNKRKRN
uniref:Uncharacterized protein n=1 Tax=Culicoides sonorensis TaxID=179676 RepID=Q66U66_CULSO|nr:unknown salivary protein [Culicoides sonorensis]